MKDFKYKDLDLKTLEFIKFTFDIHSDWSTNCNGYRSLCKCISDVKKLQDNE